MVEVNKDEPVVLAVGTGRGQLFAPNEHYIVPIYQREFAWSDLEIDTLIDDIDAFETETYTLGVLTVNRKNDKFHVIDGQQRLTALCLLLAALENAPSSGKGALSGPLRNRVSAGDLPLDYACRPRSRRALKRLFQDQLPSDSGKSDRLTEAYEHIVEKLKRPKDGNGAEYYDIGKLIDRLAKVRLYRVQVPACTDFNLYFERMNTRAEQLEQTDILKAQLMSLLPTQLQNRFALVWKACADMDSYVQEGFPAGSEQSVRDTLFGREWSVLNEQALETFFSEEEHPSGPESAPAACTLDTLLEKPVTSFREKTPDGTVDDPPRFESIVAFPVFLIHAAKVYRGNNPNPDPNPDSGSKDPKEIRDLDDSRLVPIFEKLGITKNKDEALGFIRHLLELRWLFDCLIIKRDREEKSREGDEVKGAWSLKYWERNGCKNTVGNLVGSKDEEKLNRQILMIESCLRLSYTSPRSMHWLTKILGFLYEQYQKNGGGVAHIDPKEVLGMAEGFAAAAVSEDFLKLNNMERRLGQKTPNIVFHFLDYVLWKNRDTDEVKKLFSTVEPKIRVENFVFMFRNSVEHFLPRTYKGDFAGDWENAREGSKPAIDRFGNLAIVTTSLNSQLSNETPAEKVTTLRSKKSSADVSLKLRLMAASVKGGIWHYQTACEHENQMLALLKRACREAAVRRKCTEQNPSLRHTISTVTGVCRRPSSRSLP